MQYLEAQISAQAADHAQALGKLQQELAAPESQTASSEALADLQEQYDDLLQRLQVMTEEQMHADDLLTEYVSLFDFDDVIEHLLVVLPRGRNHWRQRSLH